VRAQLKLAFEPRELCQTLRAGGLGCVRGQRKGPLPEALASLVANEIKSGRFALAGRRVTQHPLGYYFVCPTTHREMAKVAAFQPGCAPRPPSMGPLGQANDSLSLIERRARAWPRSTPTGFRPSRLQGDHSLCASSYNWERRPFSARTGPCPQKVTAREASARTGLARGAYEGWRTGVLSSTVKIACGHLPSTPRLSEAASSRRGRYDALFQATP
jgi:hypothetical protein